MSIQENILPIIAIVLLVLIGLFMWWAGDPDIPHDDSQSAEDTPLAPITRTSQTLAVEGGEETVELAEPFRISVAAENIGKARFMTMSPDGRMFVPDLVDYKLSHEGKIYILDDFNEATKRFETKHTYLSGLRGPNSVAFYTDPAGNEWIYVALTAHLVRYPYQAGDVEPRGSAEIVTEFPNTQTPGETSVVWHITRTLLFEGDDLYVAIGSGCNSCEQLEGAMRGMIVRMDPDGGNQEVYADGLRNSVGLEWARDSLWTTANGVDHLGTEAPDERMFKVTEGEHYGWPYCYEVDGEVYDETSQQWDADFSCVEAPRSFAGFEPRSAALGLEFFENAVPELNNSFLVALHGSFDPSMESGNRVMRVSLEGEKEIFLDDLSDASGNRFMRPVDILQHSENSFFVTDDLGGRILYVYAEE